PRATDPPRARHRVQRRRSKGGDSHRASIVVVTLVRRTRGQEPYPRRQGGGNVEDLLAHRHQLLGQEVAQPSSGFDGPGPLLKRRRPGQQPVGLARVARTYIRSSSFSSGPMATAVCVALFASMPMITVNACSFAGRGGPWRHSCFRIDRALEAYPGRPEPAGAESTGGRAAVCAVATPAISSGL